MFLFYWYCCNVCCYWGEFDIFLWCRFYHSVLVRVSYQLDDETNKLNILIILILSVVSEMPSERVSVFQVFIPGDFKASACATSSSPHMHSVTADAGFGTTGGFGTSAFGTTSNAGGLFGPTQNKPGLSALVLFALVRKTAVRMFWLFSVSVLHMWALLSGEIGFYLLRRHLPANGLNPVCNDVLDFSNLLFSCIKDGRIISMQVYIIIEMKVAFNDVFIYK